jgi:DNA-binding CsgD family transcriptional regulator
MASLLRDLEDRQLRQAIEVVHSLVAVSDSTNTFISGALHQLPVLVPSDLTTLSVCDLKKRTRQVFGRQAEALSEADCATFDRYFREHPLVRFHSSHRNGPTQRISDCAESQTFKGSALYADYYTRLGISHVMALPLQINETMVVSIVFNRRSSDFSSADRAVFEAIRPALSAVYRNLIVREDAEIAVGTLRKLAASNGWQIIQVGCSGHILAGEADALQSLERYFGTQSPLKPTALPVPLVSWMARVRNWGLDRGPRETEPLTVARSGMQLTIHFVADPTASGRGFLLLKESRSGLAAEHLEQLPLTLREREVLALLAAGKSNPEIATLLGISPRTVQKHLEHIFEKLGVETRISAALHAISVANIGKVSAGNEPV